MEHQRWIKHSLISAAVAASVGLTACSSGGGSAGAIDTTTTLSGVVADGYLVYATVCLDIDLSKTCDSGEPTATSTSGGSYSLDATQAQIDTYPVVAEIIAGTTVDEDNPSAPVAKAYTLSAPAGKGAFVSPLSTMVQAQIETTGKTAKQIENEILASIGQDPTVVSLFDDYVAEKSDASNSAAVQDSYLQLHQIAQVTAATIANNIETIEAAISSGAISMDLSTTLDSIITIIVQNVIAELTAISSAIDSSTTFDANTVATSVDTAVDTTTIEDQVAVAEAPSVDTSNVEAIFTAGISWLWAEFSDWESELERSLIIYNASTGKLYEPIESYFATNTPGWSLMPQTSDKLILQANGTWLAVTDSLEGSSVTFDSIAGTATINAPWGMEVMSNIKANDLTGLSVKQFVASKLPDLAKFIDPASTFTSGSNAYSLNVTSLEDSYSMWIWDGCGASIENVNGNCNTVIDWRSSQTPSPFTSLASMPYATAWTPGGQTSTPASQGSLGRGDLQGGESLYLSYELVQGATNTSGAVNYYLFNYSDIPTTVTKIGTGTWVLTRVNGTELLMVDHPDALMSQYSYITDMDSPEENLFFAIQDGVVRKGDHWPANVVETTAESILTNQQAQDEITGAFLSTTAINTVPSSELACDTNSEWNPLIDEPLVAYSFADFDAVVTTCGGKQIVDANTLTGGNIGQSYTLINGAIITFDPGNTGSYMAPTQQNNPSTFVPINWGIDPVTNYIVVEDPAGSFRFVLAVIAVDSTVSPARFTIKEYIEEAGSSDMITDQGSDGQIVNLTFQ